MGKGEREKEGRPLGSGDGSGDGGLHATSTPATHPWRHETLGLKLCVLTGRVHACFGIWYEGEFKIFPPTLGINHYRGNIISHSQLLVFSLEE